MREYDSDNTHEDFYPLLGMNYTPSAMTDASGRIVETYDVDTFSNTLIFNAAGTGGDWFADDSPQAEVPCNNYLFTGRYLGDRSDIRYNLLEKYIYGTTAVDKIVVAAGTTVGVGSGFVGGWMYFNNE